MFELAERELLHGASPNGEGEKIMYLLNYQPGGNGRWDDVGGALGSWFSFEFWKPAWILSGSRIASNK